jgi:hypothetical protein
MTSAKTFWHRKIKITVQSHQKSAGTQPWYVATFGTADSGSWFSHIHLDKAVDDCKKEIDNMLDKGYGIGRSQSAGA